ncbi:SirB2 family protein [Tepidimonas taiwanensis]|uniref:Invasion protein expression up-regulator, SirB n=1 Tax=Tepidimonas taiwanensis TaxID=307486 RepID=A0A554X2M1_9BURK|nr:SirB2 family protein [Tepidimonas taiwanensis]MDM7463190.1 SirB2 family protein [Tepidimonas taiwanensis]TSE30092.1 Invasion protein expression up-regulator, SirB [Tepidimonas taiwanensis]UBQ06411.1 SirB2 family protein [Tepidimonas taiwanensis]
MTRFWWITHVTAVTASLTLFTARWCAILAGAHWPLRPGVRGLSVLIDTVLLTAGVGLFISGGWAYALPAWLWTKWVLLLVYIGLGTWALRRARTRAGHALAGTLALTVAAHIVGAAVWRHPAGFWTPLTAAN